ncbi:hypothetical protein Ocin01_17890, partial [Orchesella cincta]
TAKYALQQSPVTEPMLIPEMWAQVFESLSHDDLQTVLNTTPEWNRLAPFTKNDDSFSKGKLKGTDIQSLRMVSKACQTGVELAYPEIRRVINLAEETLRAQENMRRAMEQVVGRIRLGMRHEARNQLREAQGLPELQYREGEEEPVPEDEFGEEEIQAYLARRLQGPPH